MPALHCTAPACPTDPFEPVGDYRETQYAAKAAGWDYASPHVGGHGYQCPRHAGSKPWWPDPPQRLAIAAAPDVPRPGNATLQTSGSPTADGPALTRDLVAVPGPGDPDVPQPVLPQSSTLAANESPPGLGHTGDTAVITAIIPADPPTVAFVPPQYAELADEIARRDALDGTDD